VQQRLERWSSSRRTKPSLRLETGTWSAARARVAGARPVPVVDGRYAWSMRATAGVERFAEVRADPLRRRGPRRQALATRRAKRPRTRREVATLGESSPTRRASHDTREPRTTSSPPLH
jgi:hypothetical protein